MIRLTIDGKKVDATEGRTILEVCRELDIHIPTLCFHPALEPYGACRLCVVECAIPPGQPKLVASCVTPCQENMVISTASSEVLNSRRLTAELLLAEDHENRQLKNIASDMKVSSVRYQTPEKDTCILCGLCVRACKEIVGVSAISTIDRGFSKKISPPFQIESETCIGCGTCVLVCPTDAIKLRDIAKQIKTQPREIEAILLGVNGGSNGKDLVKQALRSRLKRSMDHDDGSVGQA
jgi:NADH dehydrogenase/NADH:ubiquinone oxidoreductase subunit G